MVSGYPWVNISGRVWVYPIHTLPMAIPTHPSLWLCLASVSLFMLVCSIKPLLYMVHLIYANWTITLSFYSKPYLTKRNLEEAYFFSVLKRRPARRMRQLPKPQVKNGTQINIYKSSRDLMWENMRFFQVNILCKEN